MEKMLLINILKYTKGCFSDQQQIDKYSKIPNELKALK